MEDDLEDRWPEQGHARDRDHDDQGGQEQDAAEQQAEFVESTGGRVGRELGHQRGLDRLEEVEGDAGDDQPVEHAPRRRRVAAAEEGLGGERSDVHQGLSQQRARQQPAEGGGELAPAGGWSGGGDAPLAWQHDREADQAGKADGQTVGTTVGDPGLEQHQRRRDPDRPLDHEDRGVAAEPARPGQRPPREVVDRVDGHGDQEPQQHQALAVEEGAHQRALAGGGQHHHADGDADPEQQGPPHHRPGPQPGYPSGRGGPAHLLLQGQEEAGGGHEGESPQRAERRVGLGCESVVGDDHEGVGRDPLDGEGHPDDQGSRGEWIRPAGPGGLSGRGGGGDGRGGPAGVGRCGLGHGATAVIAAQFVATWAAPAPCQGRRTSATILFGCCNWHWFGYSRGRRELSRAAAPAGHRPDAAS